jgi:hypothetical protein
MKHCRILTSSYATYLYGGVDTIGNNRNSFFITNGNSYTNNWYNTNFAQTAGVYSSTIQTGYKINNVVTWKYTGSNMYLYVNNLLDKTFTASNRDASNVNCYIGATTSAAGNPFNGQMYNLFIYSGALSDDLRSVMEGY